MKPHDNLKCIGGYVSIIYKYFAILNKGFEYLGFWDSVGFWNQPTVDNEGWLCSWELLVYKCVKVVILGEVIKRSIERTLEPRAGTLTLRSCDDSKVPAKKPGKEVQDRREETEGKAAS